jgi:phenylpyruvate tautomerase PptA (4-oxalocrotonate tautomerase family)
MPLIKLQTSVECPKEKKEEISLELSRICAEGIGKPEAYVASVVEDDAVIAFGGAISPAAYVEVKSIGGLNSEVNNRLSAMICESLEKLLDIPGDHTYINFTDVSAQNWGCNSSTFG